ncbi:NAD(P)/FAD-dependent oxidoreductase [Sphingomonas crocodyli]|uniref:FAD-binding oxidoreductase n=1 Tax=Sphingomonas crocodyli TaxID=1979270 RepID=A0A437M5D4_9SPHN|nr:FAD-binding oxidoreductase [Sphingomonas crocodyli]RVT92931.1 FAD-binding oxidoreductase [Sphingomonas crocodyli]
MKRTSDALVVGGGLHGLSAGLQLARRGLKVTLFERARIGRHASGASAAGVRTLGRARAELPASLAAMEMWHHMEELVGDNCGFEPSGQIKVAETEIELIDLATKVELLRADGFTHEEMIDAAELRALVPAISRHCVGARLVRKDGAADPHRTIKAFYAAARSAGVHIHEGIGVTSIDRRRALWSVGTTTGDFEAPLLVNAGGAWAAQIAAMAGDEIPLDSPKASMMLVTERVRPFLKPTIGAVGRKLSFKQTAQGTILIGGGQQGKADLVAETSEIDGMAMSRSAAAALALFPEIANLRIVRTWAGLEAKTFDNIAIAGLSPSRDGLMHLFGFSGHGFQLVPILGVATAELLVDGYSKVDLSGLAPERLMDASGARPVGNGVGWGRD